MPVVDIWNRSVLPQGGVHAPGGTSAGEIIGQSAQNLGAGLSNAAEGIQRADMIIQRRNDDAWLGQQKPQAVLDIDQQIKDLNDPQSKTYVNPSSGDYTGAVNKLIDDYSGTLSKAAPSGNSKAEAAAYMAALKGDYLKTANRYVAESQYATRISNIDESNRKSGAVLVTRPSMFDSIVAQQEALIRGQGLSQQQADGEVAKMKRGMAGFAMNGQASSDPPGFLKNIDQWGAKGADPTDISQAQNIAEAEQKRRAAEAKAEAARQQAQYKANVASRADDAITSLQTNGGVMPLVGGKPLVTEKEIRSAYKDDPIQAQRNVDKLKKAQLIGQSKDQIKSNTRAEDDAMLASVAPVQGGIFTSDDAEVQKAVVAAVNAKRAALDDEIQQDIKDSQNDAASFLGQNGADLAQEAGQTGIVPDALKSAVADNGSAEAKAFLAKVERSADLARAGQQIKDQPASADRTMAERIGLDLSSTGPGSGERAIQADAMAKALADKQKAIASDPAGYFSASSTAISSAWDAVDQNPNDPAVAQTAVSMGVAQQQAYGLPQDEIRPFPSGRASAYATTISTAPPDQAMATIDYIRQISGDAGLKQVLSQKGVPPMASFLAFADQPGQEPIRAAGLETMKIKPEELDKLVKARGVKEDDIDTQASAAMEPLLNTLPPGAAVPYQDALTQITKLYVAKGLSPSEASQQAWSAFESAYTFHGTYRIPTSFDDQKVQDGLNSVMQNLGKMAIVPQAGSPEGAPTGYAQEQTIRQLQTGGIRWVTNADDTGLIGTYDIDQNGIPGPAVKTATGRLEVLFSDLEAGKYGYAVPSSRPGVKARPGMPFKSAP
jgi:hypothetical protein